MYDELQSIYVQWFTTFLLSDGPEAKVFDPVCLMAYNMDSD
jgi:hypothetical protein